MDVVIYTSSYQHNRSAGLRCVRVDEGSCKYKAHACSQAMYYLFKELRGAVLPEANHGVAREKVTDM